MNMKKLRYFLITVLLVTLSSLTYGQERTKRGGLDVSVAGGYLIEREELTYYADISYSHNVLPLLGVGGGITAQTYSSGEGFGYESSQIGLGLTTAAYGEVTGYVELGKYLDFLGRFDLGMALHNHNYGYKYRIDIFISPQAGFKLYFKENKRRALNLRFFYRYSYKIDGSGTIGGTLGLTF